MDEQEAPRNGRPEARPDPRHAAGPACLLVLAGCAAAGPRAGPAAPAAALLAGPLISSARAGARSPAALTLGSGIWPGRFTAAVKADEGIEEGPLVGSHVRSRRDMGLDRIAWIPEPELVLAASGDDRIGLRYRWLRMTGSRTIRRTFTFDNATYPAGERARTRFELEEGTLYYERRIVSGRAAPGAGLWIRGGGFRATQETRIRAPSAGSERRSILLFAPIFGLAYETPLGDRFGLRIAGDGSHWSWRGRESESWSVEGILAWYPARWLELWIGGRYGDVFWGRRRSGGEKTHVRWTQGGPVAGAALRF